MSLVIIMAMKQILFLMLGLCSIAIAAPPVISNIRASQRPGTKLVDIFYDLADADGNLQLVQVAASSDGGVSYSLPVTSLSGHVGANVALGTNRKITWDAGADWSGNWVPQCRVRVTAFDGTTPPAPPGMALIPAGLFQMGDNLDGHTSHSYSYSLPVRNVQVDAFFIDKHEVRFDLWQQVLAWGIANGYSIGGGAGKAANHPAQSMSWYDAIKWCNARSQKEGLIPCYYTDAAQTIIYKSGDVNPNNNMVKWDANGYRLPTEAEWEKAARGGKTGLRFPWGNEINHSHANYGDPQETRWSVGGHPYTSPVGSYPPNDFGLYDVAGNLYEFVWDYYSDSYYGVQGNNDNPKGPTNYGGAVIRGGSFQSGSGGCRAAWRNGYYERSFAWPSRGFRTVRR